MRTLKELYQLLLDKFDSLDTEFICYKISRLYWEECITEYEQILLKEDFTKRKPTIFNKFWWQTEFRKFTPIDESWWKKNNQKSQIRRKEFLQHIINSL